ncbi:hypothetical protein Tco_1341506, partial [Tanacetum coccineum]
TMADAEHAPAMAPPVRTDEQILPRIRWVPIGKSNCYLNEEKSKAGSYKCQLDEQWFDLTQDTLRVVLQIPWGVVNRAHIDYAERMWEEFTQSIHNFTEDKRNLAQQAQGKKKRKPVSKSSDAPPLGKRAKTGKVV